MTFSSEKARELAGAMQEMMVAMKEVDATCAHLLEHIAVRELNLVSFIGDRGQATMSSIAEFLHIPLSTATSVVDKMVENQILKRAASPTDRRKVLILLDREGQVAFDLFLKMRVEMSDRMMAMLSEGEVDQFIKLINKINTGMNQLVQTRA